MLFAITVPSGPATTDFGVMSPVIRRLLSRRVVFDGSPGGILLSWTDRDSGAVVLVSSPLSIPPDMMTAVIAIAIVNCSCGRDGRRGFL
ncbi:hypothetical protein GCM10009626_05580 [Brachybacterium sacelli]